MSETKTFEELFMIKPKEEILKINNLKILVLSNINSNHMYLIKLKEWQMQNKEYFDYIIFLGNFLSYTDNKNKEDLLQISKDESQIGGLLSYLENICLKIIYIGGENDCITLFRKPYPNITLTSTNIHQQYYNLADDLYLLGYGGQINFFNQDNITELFFSFQKNIKNDNLIRPIQSIFMNNLGESSDFLNSDEKIMKIMKDKNNNILINLNGNMKMEDKIEKMNGIDFINPGSICEGEFGILLLNRAQNNLWQINSFKRLRI